MSWSRPTIEQIYERIKADMESRVTADIKIPRVSMLGIMDIVFAGAMHLNYGFLLWLSKQIFVDKASLFGLTRWGNILNLPRKEATFADGTVSFSGTSGKVVDAGTGFVNDEGYEYFTEDPFTIGTDLSIACVAAEEGALYNSEDTVFALSSPDPDIDSEVAVISGFDNGTDIENVEDWVLRLLQRFQNPPSSGNTADYIRWALSRPGVGKAWCFSAEEWLGAGTVGVGVATSDIQPVSAGILSDVEVYIEQEKPIPAEVSYFTTNPLPVVIDLQLDPNTPETRDVINTNLASFFVLEAEPGGTILLSRLRSAIASAGLSDYVITEIYLDGTSQGVGNITTVKPDTANFASVNYSDIP